MACIDIVTETGDLLATESGTELVTEDSICVTVIAGINFRAPLRADGFSAFPPGTEQFSLPARRAGFSTPTQPSGGFRTPSKGPGFTI